MIIVESWDEMRHVLEDLDKRLGETGQHMEAYLFGQGALMYWAHAYDLEGELNVRETDDVDLYTPDFGALFDLADTYKTAVQQTGMRAEVSHGQYLDLISQYEDADLVMKRAHDIEETFEHLDLKVADPSAFVMTKAHAGRKRDYKDIEKMATIVNEAELYTEEEDVF